MENKPEIYQNARLIGKAIGNLKSLISYADLPVYQKEWLKETLRCVEQVDYINLKNKF
tara:strand:+ start:1060 stop:1233 length:174 start_codon:yes stop_codon:yes gene_type:complete